MKLALLLFVVSILALSGCRGRGELKCDDQGVYQRATTTPRIKAPEGLDDLEALKEMPLPEASPQAEGAGAEGCLESPPHVTGK
jgi:uncharacterized lipoprotein